MTAILFDMDDTLYEQAVPFEQAYQKTFGSRFRLDTRALFVASRKHSDATYELSVSGEMSVQDMYIYRISNAFKDLGIVITEAEALEFQHNYELEQQRISLSSNIKELLQWCNDHNIVSGIITNGPSAHQWDKLRCLGVLEWIPAERVFVSGDCGFTKPDRRLFDLARKKLGGEVNDLWYVGDSYENDILGASQAGWKCIWLNRWGRTVGQNQSDCRCDIMVRDELELIQAVQEQIVGKND